MSSVIFNDSFTVARPYVEDIEHPIAVSDAQGGRRVRRQVYPDAGLFRVYRATISFPRNDLATWAAFWAARKGPFDSFLYLPVLGIYRTSTAELLGEGDGINKVFALDGKHVKASTLTVTDDAAPVDSGDYVFSGNDTAPIITFDTAPINEHVIRATYDRYIPCVFESTSAKPLVRSLATTDATSVVRINGLTWRQDRSGSHLV